MHVIFADKNLLLKFTSSSSTTPGKSSGRCCNLSFISIRTSHDRNCFIHSLALLSYTGLLCQYVLQCYIPSLSVLLYGILYNAQTH